MKRRNANMIFNKNGNGFDTTKITIPVVWAKELGFTKDDKTAILKFDGNKIIIEKGEINMLEIIIGTACLTGFVKSVVWIISVEGGFQK